MENTKCHLIPCFHPEEIKFIWPHVRHYILGAADHAKELDEFTLLGRLFSGQTKLFVATTDNDYIGALTIEIQSFPVRTIAQIVHLGSSNFDLMNTKFDELVNWARAQGASALRLHGRRGWERRLIPLGFKAQYYVLETQI